MSVERGTRRAGGRSGVQSVKRSSVSWGKGETSPALHLGVFGKHPGWDDHIDDLGLDTDRLVRARQRLYTEGVAGNIDLGAWEKLEDEQRLPGFGHELVWRSRDGLIVGRLWSSRDGKGRTKYPMAVVVDAQGVEWSWVESVVVPRLAEVERACLATESADEVRRIVDQARVDLRTALPIELRELGGLATPAQLAALAEAPELGPDRVGLHRALYEMDRELAAFRPARGDGRRSTAREVTIGPRHLRVPACAASAMGASALWAGLLATQIDPSADVVVLRPHGRAWIDVIVGEPGVPQLFCLKASEIGLALVTSVPYSLDAAFTARCEALVGAWKAGRPTAEEQAAPAPAVRTEVTAEGAPPRKRPPWMLWGGAGAIVAAVCGVFVYQSQTRNGTPTTGPIAMESPKAAPATKPPAGSTDIAPELKARQDEAKSRLDPAAEANARLERERKVREDQDRLAAEAAATKAQTERDRLAKEESDRKAADERDRLAREESERTARTESDRVAQAKTEADRKAREDADRLAREESERNAVAERERLARAESDRKATEEQTRLAKEATDRKAREASERLAREEADRKSAVTRKAVVARAVELGALLDAGYTLSDTTGAGTVGARAAALSADPDFTTAADAPEVAALTRRIKSLDSIGAMTDGGALTRLVATGPAAESLSAWSRLASGSVAGWPGSGADISSCGEALGALRRAVAAQADPARAAATAARVNEQAKAVWVSFFSRVSAADPASINAACASREAFGVEVAALGQRERFNLAVWELKRDAPAMNDPNAARARVDAFVAQVGALGAEFAEHAEVKAMLAAAAPPAAPDAPLGADPATLGPALKGWKGEVRPVAGRPGLMFTSPASAGRAPQVLEFVRVEGPSCPAAYLCTTEVSVGLFIDAVDAAQCWPDVLPSLAGYVAGRTPNPVSGPRPWAFDVSGGSGAAQRIRLSDPADDLGRGWLPVGAKTNGLPYYPDPQKPEPPSLASPMQFLGAQAAAYVSGLVGCRLPTTAEWLAAQELNAGATANRRDLAWRRLVEFLASKPIGVQNSMVKAWPDAGQCVPEGVPAYPQQRGKLEAAVSEDDGEVWFVPVGQGQGVFRNLIGNVAEFVFDEPGALDSKGDVTIAQVKTALGKGSSVRMIGASALSASEVEATRPYPLNWNRGSSGGFSDVGFRLAFSAVGSSAVARTGGPDSVGLVRRAAEAIKYLSP